MLLLWLTRPLERAPSAAQLRFPTRSSLRFRGARFATLVVALVADAGWWTHDRWYAPGLRAVFLSVGEGDAAVVRFAGGRVMLIDTGDMRPGGFDFGERWSRVISGRRKSCASTTWS
jgi:beta-lactamase superfamily II metal-dependent hydrolase